MPLVRVNATTASVLDDAVALMRAGGVVAFPTDTLYALGAAAGSDAGVQRVYAIKGREPDNPLPLLVDGEAMAERVAVLNDAARRLINRLWPGPLTIVLPVQPDFHSLALAGGATVALRAPALPLALSLIGSLGGPITGTSANRSGGEDPDSPDEVAHQLEDAIDLLIDDGPSPGGVASTIVDLTQDDLRIVRSGGLAEDRIRAALAL